MKPQSCKAKGRRLQQQIASDIIKAFPHLKDDDVFSTSMGCGGEDIKMSPLCRNSIPLSIEAKNQEKLNIWEAYAQAESNCPKDVTPCVVFKKNHSKTFAMLPWDKLLYLFVECSKKNNIGTRKRMKQLIDELSILVKDDSEENTHGEDSHEELY
tara:strand:+ start:1727 stop:2191 length:465 start_codon:yes stop_codon:yes gene_type:complete